MVDFYGDQGFWFHTDRFSVRRTAMGDDAMHPAVTAVLKVTKPAAAKAYRVWLIQQLLFQSRITLRLQDLVSSTAADTLLHLPRPVARHLAITSSVTASDTVTRWCRGCTGRLFPSMRDVNQ